MATDAIPARGPLHGDSHAFENYLTHDRGLLTWIATLDHKRIGVMYLVGILSSFFLGGMMALAIRAELFTPDKMFLSENKYNEFFTVHGAVMTFLFIIPGIPAALGNFVLPLMLGAKDVAFPRMNLFSFYLWVGGAMFFLAALFIGGLDTGWTFYTPYSTRTNSVVVAATLGAFILGFSSIFTGLNFVVTINTMRPPGMTWFKMPLFLWALYSTAIIQLLATPVLGITLLLLTAEKVLGIGIFDPKLGGDPVLFQHFFWFYSHPAVYIMILPAMGIISELMSVFSRKHIFGYRFIAYSSVAIALLGFLVWGHHMFVSGQSRLAAFIFSALTFSVSIPSGIKVFNWLATMYKGSNFHYVMMGGTLIAFLGGLHYWWPKMFGRMYNETWARLACLIVFIGFNATFLPQFLLGSRGMPRRYARYEVEFQGLHQLSTIGAMILGVGLFMAGIVLLHSLFAGKRAAANPWGSASLEWLTTSPPSPHNFDDTPVAGDPYDYSGLEYDPGIDGYVKKKTV